MRYPELHRPESVPRNADNHRVTIDRHRKAEPIVIGAIRDTELLSRNITAVRVVIRGLVPSRLRDRRRQRRIEALQLQILDRSGSIQGRRRGGQAGGSLRSPEPEYESVVMSRSVKRSGAEPFADAIWLIQDLSTTRPCSLPFQPPLGSAASAALPFH